jgi:MFS family permease
LLFAHSLPVVVAAMPLLGIGYAVQDTLLKAIVAGALPRGRRHLAFGLFYSGYGCGWLIGSVALGLLYAHSWIALQLFAVLVQLASLPVFIAAQRQAQRH